MSNPLTDMVIFDKHDYEAHLVINIFKGMQFTYGMSSKPTGFNYEALKDAIKWRGIKPKNYVPLLTNMFHSFIRNMPSE